MTIAPHAAAQAATCYESHPGRNGPTAASLPVSGNFFGVLIGIEPGAWMRGISTACVGVGSTGLTNWWGSVLDLNFNVLAVTADQLTTPVAVGAVDLSFTTPVICTVDAVYAGFVWAGTTPPQIWAQAMGNALYATGLPGVMRPVTRTWGGLTTPWAVGSQQTGGAATQTRNYTVVHS